MPLRIDGVDHVVINVSDLAASVAWYQRVLGMEPRQSGFPPRVALHFGQQKIHLRPVSVSKQEWFTADHEAAGSDDLCFITRSTPEEVLRHLAACGVAAELGPVERMGARGPMISVYCRDPDGSLIEIAHYPEP